MKSPVTYSSPLRVEKINGTRYWRTLWPFNAEWRGFIVKVPEGFKHDGNSVPRVFRSFVSAAGGEQAAATHDWSYTEEGAPHMSREEVDAMFRDGIETLMLPAEDDDSWSAWWQRKHAWLRSRTMWTGVRAAGWAFFK